MIEAVEWLRPDDVLRVMTLNTWFHPPLDARVAEISAWLAAVDPHVVCLQEIESHGAGVPTVADRLARSLPEDWHVALTGYPRERTGTLVGTAVLSRWPIENHTVIQLPCLDSVPKSVLHARTAGLDVFSVHLASAPDAAGTREEHVLRLDEFVRVRRDENSPLPPVVAGDFNATPGSSAIRFLRGEQSLSGQQTFFQDAWAVAGDGPGHTWTRVNPHTPPAHLFDARCDYIFVGTPRVPISWRTGDPDTDPIGQVTSTSLVCHHPRTGVYASDHFGVAADICYPGTPATR